MTNLTVVIPAKAGTQLTCPAGRKVSWTPAFAGMTNKVAEK